jgi:hypothetical protein
MTRLVVCFVSPAGETSANSRNGPVAPVRGPQMRVSDPLPPVACDPWPPDLSGRLPTTPSDIRAEVLCTI